MKLDDLYEQLDNHSEVRAFVEAKNELDRKTINQLTMILRMRIAELHYMISQLIGDD